MLAAAQTYYVCCEIKPAAASKAYILGKNAELNSPPVLIYN